MKFFDLQARHLLLLLTAALAVSASSITLAHADGIGIDATSETATAQAHGDLPETDKTANVKVSTFQGTVTKVNDNGFTLALAQDGRTLDIATDKSTRFTIVSVANPDSLKIGDTLAIQGYVDQDTGTIAARGIVQLESTPSGAADAKRLAALFTVGNISSLSPLAIYTSTGKSLLVKTAYSTQLVTRKPGLFSELNPSDHIVVGAVTIKNASVAVSADRITVSAQTVDVQRPGAGQIDLAMATVSTGDTPTNSEGIPIAASSSLRTSIPMPAQTNEDSLADPDDAHSDRPISILPPRQPVSGPGSTNE